MRLARDSNSRRPVDIARQLQHLRLVVMLDPEVPLRQAVSSLNQRASFSQGCLPLSVLAGRIVQVILAQQAARHWMQLCISNSESCMGVRVQTWTCYSSTFDEIGPKLRLRHSLHCASRSTFSHSWEQLSCRQASTPKSARKESRIAEGVERLSLPERLLNLVSPAECK